MNTEYPETELGAIATLWDCLHKTPSYSEDGYPMVRVTDIKRGSLDLSGTLKVQDKTYQEFIRRYKPKAGDILLSRVGSYGNTCYVNRDQDFCLGQNTVCIASDQERIIPYFLYCCFNAPSVKHQMDSFVGGSSQPTISLKNISLLRIPTPNIAGQRKIAAILSAYDDLIENNLRRIKILEEMAQNLYREWFVKFRFPGHQHAHFTDSPFGPIPEGWEVKALGELAVNFDRLRKPLSSIQRAERKGIYPYYGAAKIFDYIDAYIFDGIYLLMAEDGSVVTTDRKPVLQYVSGKFWPNNHTHILQGKGSVSTEFLYMVLSEVDITGYITGAAQPKITQANLNRIPVVVAEDSILQNFNEFVRDVFRQKIVIGEKNKTLRRTRDQLLPWLISGEVDVSELDITISEEAAA